ncbi:A-kinase anchor protein 11 isoform X2 [Corythoichthys intestinalis]|uniref:A-kinase anchor protein 11 isoform X2 n=1 Tax=Corythoichthys intestinalis TaxID=161448 RepID=UPI0025A5DA8D|nr:A-kinase anchor protein 11 isoform X2 [Corythoichthys intestinalis]
MRRMKALFISRTLPKRSVEKSRADFVYVKGAQRLTSAALLEIDQHHRAAQECGPSLVDMDACARVRGAPIRSRAFVRKETVRDTGAQFVKSILRSRKDLCSINLELPSKSTKVTEVHFVCLPGQNESDDAVDQALASLPAGMCEMLRTFHVHGLRNDEVQLFKDSRRLKDPNDSGPQCWLKAVCVFRHNPCVSGQHPATFTSLTGLIGCYVTGVRYALELQRLHRGEARPSEDDDTNQSVSSIEDDFVTALENLEEDETGENSSYLTSKKRDVASQTVPAHKRRKELSGSHIIISSSSKKYVSKHKPGPEVSVTVQRSSGTETQWTYCSQRAPLSSPPVHISESEESDGSSPSPIIFLDEVGYQKSMLAKLDIPQVPGGPRERVEDSDSEVSEFFDSFDQFDDLEDFTSERGPLMLPMENESASTTQTVESNTVVMASKDSSTKGMFPHCFDQPILPANVKKPTPLKPSSPYGPHSEVPDSPQPVQSPTEDNAGPLFSPVSSSAFSPLIDSSGVLEYFWKKSEDGRCTTELRKPQDLCSLYKTYSDFASNLSKEILGSVCGYQSATDINDNKNLSCVCHKEFTNPLGYTMKLSDIQDTVTVAKLQKTSQCLKDGIQRFATDLVEMSLGSALRDLQKGVSTCTTTLCHLAARLTSSVFQMAFHEIGMRQAYVLKDRAMNGLANFLVGEAISGALKEFLNVKKQIFHCTVSQFAADLAEELIFEGIMEVCQFSHPSTPLTPSDWTFGRVNEEEEEEEVVTSYASDLSESVIQEAFIELSQADIAFTSQAAISVSPVNAGNMSAHTRSSLANQQLSNENSADTSATSGESAPCTVKDAIFTVSGMASCIPVPQVGQAISCLKDPEDQRGSSSSDTLQASPKKIFSSDTCTETHIYSNVTETPTCEKGSLYGKSPFQNFSGNMVEMIVTEACEVVSASKKKTSLDDDSDILANTVVSQRATLHVPNAELGGQKMSHSEGNATPNSGQKSGRTPGTPPSTPQQPSEISKEKQIKQFSKKLKSKLAKEFSPATPPPTPHYHPEPGLGPTEKSPEADKTEFMLKLMRSLSEEADGNEDEEEDDIQEDPIISATDKSVESESRPQELRQLASHKLSNKEALHYAEQLACHIVSMATEIDTLRVDDEVGEFAGPGERRRDSVAQFSQQTLNSLWVYAGEVAGEVISHVKRMVTSVQGSPRGSVDLLSAECLHHHHHHTLASTDQNRDWRVERVAEQWSNNLLASVLRSPGSTSSRSSSGLSSAFPSCESVTDEYAGYLIRVLRKEGGSRELVLDQYASRLAYRSIKQGLAHASRKIKQRSAGTRLRPSKSLPDEWKTSSSESTASKDLMQSVGGPSCEDPQYCCRKKQSSGDSVELVNFAESLAHNITCDVTRTLRLSSVRLSKSLTDSCLYKKSKLENMTENLIRNSFSCPLLSKDSKVSHYHSTESLLDGGYNRRMMQVIEHYARKIVDDTLKLSLASVGHSSQHHLRTTGLDKSLHAQRLSEVTRSGSVQGQMTCQFCQNFECPYCTKFNQRHYQTILQRRRRGPPFPAKPETLNGLEIPKIHIDLEHKSAFAEQMVTLAMENAKRELSNTSLNADSGIGHDGTSYAESFTAEIMTSALNVCQAASISSPGREATESTVSQQLSVGDDSLGSWSNLSFEDDNSSFLHLSDSNGNSSSWSSLGLEGEPFEEHMSSSPSDSDHTDDKETDVKEESNGTLCVDTTQIQAPRSLLIILNSDIRELRKGHQHMTLDPQLRSLLQWAAASIAGIPLIQLSPDKELQQLPSVVQRLRERKWRVGDLLHLLLRYCEEPHSQPKEETPQSVRDSHRIPLFKWLLEHT